MTPSTQTMPGVLTKTYTKKDPKTEGQKKALRKLT